MTNEQKDILSKLSLDFEDYREAFKEASDEGFIVFNFKEKSIHCPPTFDCNDCPASKLCDEIYELNVGSYNNKMFLLFPNEESLNNKIELSIYDLLGMEKI